MNNPNDHCAEFFLYFFRLCYSRKIFFGLGHGAATQGRWRLPKDEFLNFTILVPPLAKQQTIVAELDDKCDKIDRLVLSVQREITMLHEYRTRLISDVVTGKLDVQGIAVPEYEAVEETAGEIEEDFVETEGDENANE